jgi:hypothetical protein
VLGHDKPASPKARKMGSPLVASAAGQAASGPVCSSRLHGVVIVSRAWAAL